MPFKDFDAYGAASRPEATLRASGYLFLSKGIMKRARCEGATLSKLMFDEENDVLGISLYSDFDTSPSESIREATVEKSGISVNLTPLLRYYNFPEMKDIGKQVFPVTFDAKIIVMSLKGLRTAEPPVVSKPVNTPEPEGVASEHDFDDDIPF